MAGKFELFKDKAGEFRFRLKAGNGEIIGQSEGYTTKNSALNGIKSVRTNALDEGLYTILEGKNGKTYFNLKAKNHQIILSSQGYSSKGGAESGIKSVMNNAPDAEIIEV